MPQRVCAGMPCQSRAADLPIGLAPNMRNVMTSAPGLKIIPQPYRNVALMQSCKPRKM
jgi:hypothetical protein